MSPPGPRQPAMRAPSSILPLLRDDGEKGQNASCQCLFLFSRSGPVPTASTHLTPKVMREQAERHRLAGLHPSPNQTHPTHPELSGRQAWHFLHWQAPSRHVFPSLFMAVQVSFLPGCLPTLPFHPGLPACPPIFAQKVR